MDFLASTVLFETRFFQPINLIGLLANDLLIPGVKEALHGSVVPAITLAAHGTDNSMPP
jgi:hypothetical protein